MLKRLFDQRLAALMFMLAFVVGLSACASLGVPTADTVNKKAAEGYITITAAANVVTTARVAGKMSEADRDKTVAALQSFKVALDTVVKSAPTDPAAADAKLRDILLALNALSAGLATQQAGGK